MSARSEQYARAASVRSALKDARQTLEAYGEDTDGLKAVREFVEPFLPPTVKVKRKRIGDKLPLRDKRGKRLHVGDEVHVVNSCRFGDPDGVVAGPSEHDPSRVLVRLSGEFEGLAYEPSLYRVKRTSKAAKSDGEAVAE